MGYREDVIIAYTKDGWNDLMNNLYSSGLTDEQINAVTVLIDDADEHVVNDDGEHCIRWDSIKTYCDDGELLFNKLNKKLEPETWFATFLGEDGASESFGNWYDNPFQIYVSHSLSAEVSGCRKTKTYWKPLPSDVVAAAPAVVIDNHTCSVCGNNKCSTNEKSCWKCGTPIHG